MQLIIYAKREFKSLRHRLHERSFICNRIDFAAVTPSVYKTPIETVIENVSIWNRCHKWSVFKTMRFYLSCKQRNRIDLNTVTILVRNLHYSIENSEFSTYCSARLYHYDMDFLVKTDPCKYFQTASILTRFEITKPCSCKRCLKVQKFCAAY